MWVYDFTYNSLTERMCKFIEDYNAEVDRYKRQSPKPTVDQFVNYNLLKWDETLKNHLKRGNYGKFELCRLRNSIYRPYTKKVLYFDWMFNSRIYLQNYFFPNRQSETENRVICCTGVAYRSPSISALIVDTIPNLSICSAVDSHQCFPFYTYDADGKNRRENITDWALAQFQRHYDDQTISKWQIFYYVYALLHHPAYRERYALDLKRNLPRLPFALAFRA